MKSGLAWLEAPEDVMSRFDGGGIGAKGREVVRALATGGIFGLGQTGAGATILRL